MEMEDEVLEPMLLSEVVERPVPMPPLRREIAVQEPATPIRGSAVVAWLVAMTLVLMLAYVLVPRMAEEIQYSLTRGRQRADHELAGKLLQNASLSELSHASQSVTMRIAPSVAIINVNSQAASAESLSEQQLLERFHPQTPDAPGQGSGVVVGTDGYILTNYHVVRDAKDIRVTLSDGRHLAATRIGYDQLTDLALLKVKASNLIPVEWGDSDKLEVGSLLWAVGSPFGLDRSVSFGILSAKNRGAFAGSPHQDFLQTDAAINPGNSGGPLVDAQGNVVGINTAIVGKTYSGVGFAIPSNVARSVADRLKQSGYVPRAWLGVELAPVSETIARQAGLTEAEGALITRVVSGGSSPAFQARLMVGDVVLQWENHKILEPTMLSQLVANTPIGTRVTLHAWRDGKPLEVQLTVIERPREYN